MENNNIPTRIGVTTEPEKKETPVIVPPAPPLAPPKPPLERRAPLMHKNESAARPRVSSPQNQIKSTFPIRFFDVLATTSLVALFFGLPLFFTGLTFQGIDFERQIYFYFWLFVGLIAWVAKGILLGEMKIRRTPLDILLLVFLASYLVSASLSVDRWHSFLGSFIDPSRGFAGVAGLVLVYFFVLSHFTPQRFKWMIGSFLIASWLVVLWMFLLTLGVHFVPTSWESWLPLTPFGNLTAAILFCALTLPLFIAVISRVQESASSFMTKTGATVLLLLGMLMALFTMLAGYKQGGPIYLVWWVALGGFAFFTVYILAQMVRLAHRWGWLPMVTLVILLASFMVGENGLARVNFPIEAIPNVKLSWEVAQGSLKESLFFGSGPGMYAYDFSKYYPAEYNIQPLQLLGLRFYQGAGFLFEALPTLGIVGTCVLLVLLLSFLSVGMYLLSHGREHNKVYSLGLWSATLMFLAGAALVPVNGSLLLVGSLLSILALGTVFQESGTSERYTRLSLKSSPQFALALAFVFIVVSAGVAFTFVFIGKAFWADTLAGNAAKRQEVGAEAVGTLARAIQYMPNEGRYYALLGQMHMALANKEAAKPDQERDINFLRNEAQQSSQASMAAKSRMPNDITVQQMVAQTYENMAVLAANDPSVLGQAQAEYERAVELEPNNPALYLKLGQIKRVLASSEKGDAQRSLLEASKSLFQSSIDRKADFIPGYLSLSLAQESLGDIDGAIASSEKAFILTRKNADLARSSTEVEYVLARLYRTRGHDEDLKRSEALLKDALSSNDKDINLYMSLGLVYEKMKRDDDAIKSYQKVLELLQDDKFESARKQIQQMIEAVRSGKGNIDSKGQVSVESVTTE